MLGRLPSCVGYRPTFASEIAEFEERIASVAGAAITSVQAVYVPADDFTDPAVAEIFSRLGSSIVLSGEMGNEGMMLLMQRESAVLDRQFKLIEQTCGTTTLIWYSSTATSPSCLQMPAS